MSKYTEESFDKLLKKDLISIALSQQTDIDAANSDVMDQTHEFNETYEKLQSLLNVAKRVNSVFHGASALKLMGVPHNANHDKVIWRKKILKKFEKVVALLRETILRLPIG